MACNCSTYRSNIASARNDNRIWAAEIEGFREKIRDARSIISDFQDHQSSVDDHKSKLDQMADAEHGRFSGNNHKIRYVTKVKAVATSLSSVKSAISSNISNWRIRLQNTKRQLRQERIRLQQMSPGLLGWRRQSLRVWNVIDNRKKCLLTRSQASSAFGFHRRHFFFDIYR